eukprot:g1992.t1
MKISNVVVLALHLFQVGKVSALCAEDYHVVNGVCVACPSGQSNLAGDDPSGQDTSCDTCKINTNQELRDHVDSWIANPFTHPCGPLISEWEVGRITDMSYVFCADEFISQCYVNRSNFNSDISKWNTASVTSLEGTFYLGAYFTGDNIAYWDTSRVTSTRHERLVMFLGCGIAEDGTGFLVTEFMDGGSLDRALWAGGGRENVSTSWTQRIQILLDVVDALGYLHLYHKSIHQDLKSPNILLEKIVRDEDDDDDDESVTHRAKLADFGLSKIFNKGKARIGTTKETKKSTKDAITAANWISMKRKGFVGTPRWMAPEMMSSQVKIGPSVDIYSFGVVMWEVWSGRKPWSELSDKMDIF